MVYTPLIRAGLLLSMIPSLGLLVTAQTSDNPCVKIAGVRYVDPADALACQKSFAFNETLRQNILSVVSRVFDFHTYEDFYLNSPPPFEESTKDIRAEIARINTTQYATDYDFNKDLWDFTTQLNDGHTRWFPKCYTTFQSLLPAPVVILDNGIFIAPDAVELLNNFGSNFTDFFEAKQFNWQRLAGAQVLTINGLSALDYIDNVARTVSGNYLDHNIRVNSVVSSYRIIDSRLSQRLGDLAAPNFLKQTNLTFSIIPVNSNTPETVEVPFVSVFIGNSFEDETSYWDNNCAATNVTNGNADTFGSSDASLTQGHYAEAGRVDLGDPMARISLPDLLAGSTLSPTSGSTGVIKSYILPGNKTGVMFVGSFQGNFTQFPLDVEAAIREFKAAGVTNLMIDVTNNGGGYVCLGMFFIQYITGTEAPSPTYQSTSRANPLAQKVVEANIEQRQTSSVYTPTRWLFVNGTRMPITFNYNNPPLPSNINGRNDFTSQRFLDRCPTPNVDMPATPPFDLEKVVIVGNGNCASTCAHFTTAMFERHQTRIVVFGGNQNRSIEYKGMAGQQVLEWATLDREIKLAGLKDDSLAPPDLLVNGNMRVNWRNGYSFLNDSFPIAYISQKPQFRFPYTATTYKSPLNVWLFTEETLLK